VAYQTDNPLRAWELGLNQTVATAWDVYARAAKSYRVANVDENRFLLTPLRPQTARDAELGMRYAGRSVSTGVRVFRQSTQDEIAYDNNTFSNVNMSPIRRTGLELEGQWKLSSAWQLAGSLQQIRARFSAGPYLGKRPPHVARTQAQARLAWLPAASHRIEASLNHRSASVLGNDWNNACVGRTPARTTLDLHYSFAPAGQRWSISAGVDNLTDRQTFGWGFTNATCSATNTYPEAGRSFKLKARYSF
jgi:iron complex outermembrane recepter protein